VNVARMATYAIVHHANVLWVERRQKFPNLPKWTPNRVVRSTIVRTTKKCRRGTRADHGLGTVEGHAFDHDAWGRDSRAAMRATCGANQVATWSKTPTKQKNTNKDAAHA